MSHVKKQCRPTSGFNSVLNTTPRPASMSVDYGFKPNFSSTHEVTLDYPLSKVFETIGTAAGHERVTTLSSLASHFELYHRDVVSLDKPLDQTNARTKKDEATSNTGLPRQFFAFQETVPMMFGLVKTVVHLSGTLTWDDEKKLALYETFSDKGIQVWKIRRFEEIDGKTRVHEEINGVCQPLLKAIVEKETRKAHQ